jgi:hypothetical protein
MVAEKRKYLRKTLDEKQDFFWNLFATLFKVASSAMLIPFLLSYLPTEDVAVYTVFISISSLVYILDFGFNPSFTRNIAYAFSGITSLKKEGLITEQNPSSPNRKLLFNLIASMKWFYSRISALVIILMLTLGVYYFSSILKKYPFDSFLMWIGYLIFVSTLWLNIVTVWYECLIIGSGNIKKSKQFFIIGQVIYLVLSVVLVVLLNSINGVFISSLISLLVVRRLSRMFVKDLIRGINLDESDAEIITFLKEYILPNAKKIGLTSLGGALITKAAFFIGSLYLSLEDLSSYGITYQLLSIVSLMSMVYLNTYIPKISKLRVSESLGEIRKIVKEGMIFLVVSFSLSVFVITTFGSKLLLYIGSETTLLSPKLYLVLLCVNFFVEAVILFSGNVLLTKNYVPFYKASIVSGMILIMMLFIFMEMCTDHILVLLTIPLIVNLAYQGWKWIWEVYKDLDFE